MSNELFGILLIFASAVLLSIPLGVYIARVYLGEQTFTDFLTPLENLIFKICGIDQFKQMNWKQHLLALLTINLIWFVYAMLMLTTQDYHFWNPDNNPSMSYHLAFNTTISFLVNCNLQDYSGETGLSYLSQMAVVTFFQFVSAASGMAMAAVVFNAMQNATTDKLGNFFNYFLKSLTRILLPLSMLVAVILLVNGTPATMEGKDTVVGLQGDSVQVSRGPAAPMIAIKQLGTNGGGFFGANSAHPFENPNYFTNIIETVSIVLIPIAMVFALGYYLNRRKLAWIIFGVMTAGFLLFLVPTVYYEMSGNPEISKMGIDQSLGNLEGKEMRFGSAASAMWGVMTTVTSNGSVNAMHDSFNALSGMFLMLGMMVNAFYGGVGVGYLNFYIFIIVAVFIAGLMVGRTPEFLGRKIEAREIKIAIIMVLFHPFLILIGTALASYGITRDPSLPWLNNPGFHGFSEMLYQYTSSAANNGSGFEGLGDNTPWWNISAGFVLIFGRYPSILGAVAIAGLLARKKHVPESAGTLKTDSLMFGVMIFAVIFIITALAFFPALALGPIAEFFSMN